MDFDTNSLLQIAIDLEKYEEQIKHDKDGLLYTVGEVPETIKSWCEWQNDIKLRNINSSKSINRTIEFEY